MSEHVVVARAPYGPIGVQARAPYGAIGVQGREPYGPIIVLSRILSPVLPVALATEAGGILTTEAGARLILE